METLFKNTGKNSQEPMGFSEKAQRIKAVLLELYETTSTENVIKIMDEIAEFQRRLVKKYPRAMDYALLHALIGSTLIKKGIYTYEDFPGDDSVEKFMNDLAEKYK